MDIKTDFFNLPVSDGTTMRAYVARPEKPRGALIVFPEIFGVNSHIRDVTERFAREGYVAISPEVFHRTAPAGWESGYSDINPAIEHMKQIKPEGLIADIRAVYDWLQQNAKGMATAAVGYCMGGMTTTLASITVPLACGISYYGGGIAPSPFGPGLLDKVKDLKAPMLFFWGGKDHMITPDHVNQVTSALRAAGKPFASVEFSYADHGFFCDQRPSYNPEAAAEAWPLTLAYLQQHTQKAASAG